MKKLVLLFSVIFLGTMVGFAQNGAKATPEKNPNAPRMAFESLVYDYGTIYQHGDGNCEFRFTNEGKEPLVLSNVRSSCGCTVPDWPRKPILPGKSDVIKVRYATNRLGKINKSITVQSNADNSPMVLRIAGNVIPKPKEEAPRNNLENAAAPVSKPNN
ncbi:MAG: hypothetical protein CSA95_06185 [Bacteroidetes bacterium]|nr:MAG: hypothetical protein CSA95_06185 [Bacteroidota bacterium]